MLFRSSIKEFASPLMVGIACGTYTSVCITGALWYVMKVRADRTAVMAGTSGAVKSVQSTKAAVPDPADQTVSAGNQKKSGKRSKTRKKKKQH